MYTRKEEKCNEILSISEEDLDKMLLEN